MTKKNIASLYPSPLDEQLRHEFNSAVFSNGKLFAYEEGKVTSIKNDGTSMFPERSLLLGLKELNLKPSEVHTWVLPKTVKVNKKNLYLFFSDLLKAYNGNKKDFSSWCKKKIKFIKHHDMHIFSAIGSSNYSKGVYLSADGGGDEGDRRHFTWGSFEGNIIKEFKCLRGLNSISNFHGFITEFCGFRNENGKVSGLSAYGKVNLKLKRKLEKIIINNNSGIYFNRHRRNKTKPNLKNFNCDSYDRVKVFRGDLSLTNVFDICQGYLPQDVAQTGEAIIAEQIVSFLKKIKIKYFKDVDNVVFSGGLFLNVKVNEAIENSNIFRNCFFPAAPSDSGLSLGGIMSQKIKINRNLFSKYGLSPYIGPSFKDEEINNLLNSFRLNFSVPKKIEKDIAHEINRKKIVGVFFDKAEYGQRSLGNRSILADPRDKLSKILINQKIKKRDWFMPFAPAILDKYYKNFFKSKNPSLFMQKAEKISNLNRKLIPSAVHVDGSARVQYVDKKISPKFWKIIEEFYKISNLPMLLNTSFNRHGISTICSPRQAIEHLLEGCMDILYIENYKVEFDKNRKVKKKTIKFFDEKEMLKKNNILWLRKNRYLMSKKALKKYKKSLKEIN